MRGYLLKLLLIVFFVTIFHNGPAQENHVRPKIGLTLSGGGAKGLAHIGILEAIDSAGLRIDAITGTSMGSIIGALYAAGYSGESIEKIGRKLDWDLMFSTTPKLNSISIERKEEYNKYALEIPFENGRFKIGKGIIEGQELYLKFAELFEPVYYINDFSKFPIPFKCIGTDLETGDAVVMDHGDITTCVRASMAIPSVFTPVQYEGKTLVDGGLVNNFPVLDVKSMGADIVIGVNLNKGLEKAEDLNSPVDILLQICSYKDAEHFQKHREACNIYILPELKDYSAGSFAASDSLIDIGKECAKKYYPVFKRLADSLNAIYPNEPFVRNRLPKSNPVIISDYSVEGLKHTREKFFYGLLDLNDNSVYSSKKVTESVRRVYSSLYYGKINFGFVQPTADKTQIHFKVEENPLTSVKFALNYSTFTSLGLKFNITSQDLILKESRALASVDISQNPKLYLEYYKYLGQSRTSGIHLSYYNENIDYPVYEDFRLKDNLRSGFSEFDLRLQHNFNKNMFIGFGQQFINSKIRKPESPELTFNGSNTYLKSYMRYVLNSLDKKYFATKGWKVTAEAGYVYAQSPDFTYNTNNETVNSDTLGTKYNNYPRIFISADHFSPINSKLVFSQNTTLAYIIDDNPFITNQFLTGGISEIISNQVPFAGLEESEIKTGSLAAVRLSMQYSLSKNNYLTGRFNAAIYDFQGAENITASGNLLTGYGLTFGYDSAIGPIEITAMYCDQDGKVRYSMNLGFSF
jgi:NTE family protein